MNILKSLFIIILVCFLNRTASAQNFRLNFSSNGFYDGIDKPVSGFDDGKTFVTTQDLTLAVMRLYTTNYNIVGNLNLSKGRLMITSGEFKNNSMFTLKASDDGEYVFTGNGIDIVIDKQVSRVVIITTKVNKHGENYTFLAVFGRPI